MPDPVALTSWSATLRSFIRIFDEMFDRVRDLFLGGALISGVWYIAIGWLHKITPLEARYKEGITVVQFLGIAFLAVVVIFNTLVELRKALKNFAARATDDAVSKVLGAQFKDVSVGAIATEDVVNSVKQQLKRVSVDNAQLTRLVEQKVQEKVIDNDYLRRQLGGLELSALIAEYLQPLPRNAKRFMNRFRVNLLIAHNRHLLDSDEKGTGLQICKWLILAERWPQLYRALTMSPEEIVVLEVESAAAAPPAVGPENPPKETAAPVDRFMDSIKRLTPFYVGDEDLRRFIGSEPRLAPVLKSLVHFGEPGDPAA